MTAKSRILQVLVSDRGIFRTDKRAPAIAKNAGIKFCESYKRQYGTDYHSVMPFNLYGPYNTFRLKNSHLMLALVRCFHEALGQDHKQVTVLGADKPRHEFLHVEDMAAGSIFILDMERSESEIPC
ncbi:NAD-dependent epimerase/dehydratase family protein [Novosphingobium beihaiensis]|uniref:NAD-dependent epimerase/dehydratase family protein n=1 Tax=Novosphingobium beihaiensis TaxID=2930389 RepID=A0ABT0BW41_9SPHN|nr:NAD-dependent epimerase/dehydratase family protein [Novosphingobium beihaiensis]MCJ2189280.1 NAD-dependent epimerase/dehydratase family protein [Novosphingobium beihaiensis]